MARREIFICDVPGCGKQKGTTNHWFIARDHDSALTFFRWNVDLASKNVSLCGQECALKYLAQWLDTAYPPAATPSPVDELVGGAKPASVYVREEDANVAI